MHQEAEHTDEEVLDVRVVVHDDGHPTHVGQVAHRPPHDVLPVQPLLAGRVQHPVVPVIVVPLGEHPLHGAAHLCVRLDGPVHNGDFSGSDGKVGGAGD